jgi:hypothetical protein
VRWQQTLNLLQEVHVAIRFISSDWQAPLCFYLIQLRCCWATVADSCVLCWACCVTPAQWKRKAEQYLVASGLNYTIIHPGGETAQPHVAIHSWTVARCPVLCMHMLQGCQCCSQDRVTCA